MTQHVAAVYENGVLRPLEPLRLAESQRVSVTISTPESGSAHVDSDLVERAKAEVAAMERIPTIEEVREMLSKIPGSMAQTVIAERGDD